MKTFMVLLRKYEHILRPLHPVGISSGIPYAVRVNGHAETHFTIP